MDTQKDYLAAPILGSAITAGQTPNGDLFIGYALTGNDRYSKARRLTYDNQSHIVRTQATDRKVLAQSNTALLLYPVIAAAGENNDILVAGSGLHTDLWYDAAEFQASNPIHHTALALDIMLAKTMNDPCSRYDANTQKRVDITTFEPNAPDYTPRISAVLGREGVFGYFGTGFNIVYQDENGERKQRIWRGKSTPGTARTLHTYHESNEGSLLPFLDDPIETQISVNSADELVDQLWTAMNNGKKPRDNYPVGAAVMLRTQDGEIEARVRNRFDDKRHRRVPNIAGQAALRRRSQQDIANEELQRRDDEITGNDVQYPG